MSAAEDGTTILRVEDLHGGYGNIPILSGISMTLAKGEFVGILGHNGMGKTTLLRTLMGYLPATGGRVTLGGQDVTRASPTVRARAGIGYVPQGREIFPGLTVRDNLRIACRRGPAREKETIAGVLEQIPRLRAYLDRSGGALSGGEQQLLALARCLCAEPDILLLDEPTEGIQPSIILEIAELLRSICQTRGLTVLLVEQNLSFLRSLVGRLLILRKGTIVRELSAAEAQNAATIHEGTGMA